MINSSMEFLQFLAGTKYKIIQELGKKSQSASELAKTLKTSIANATQQLKLLEAYGIIKKEGRQNNQGPGKPKTFYEIKKEQNYIITLRKDGIKKIKLPVFWGYDLFIKMAELVDLRDQYFVPKFCFHTEDILKLCDAMALVKSTSQTVEFLLFTEHLDKVRKEYSNVVLKDLEGKEKKIVCWTHNENELVNGIENSEKYFMDMLKSAQIIWDKDGKLSAIKELRETK